jgi:hypothetical protein
MTKLFILLSCFLFLFSFNSCISGGGIQIGKKPKPKGGPPSHAPAHGYRAKHKYHYYPSAQVYFDLSREVYFYLEGGAWKMSVSLPDYLDVKIGDYVSIDMNTDKPYTRYAEHKKKYPPGQLKKKKKGKKGKKGKKW